MSLRARVVSLVVGAVLLTLLAMAVPGRRIALQEFEASVRAIVVESSADASTEVGPILPEDLATFESEIRSAGTDARQIWVTVSGAVRASNDPSLEKARSTTTPDGFIELERETPRGLERIRLGGGLSVRAPDGTDAGRLFHLPATDDVMRRGEAFSRALDRRLLVWAALVVAVGTALAVAIVGHVLGPLRRLGVAAASIADGDLSARTGSGGPPEIRAVARAFDHMAAHLEASERSRREMVRNVAHDLRTPLTNLRGQIESLQDGLRPLDRSVLASLHDETLMLTKLVGDVERLARADEGRLELEPEVIGIADVVHRCTTGFITSGRLRAEAVSIRVPPTLTAFVDRAAAARAFQNVLDNAAVHAPGAEIDVSGWAAGSDTVIEIRDDGPGIAPEHLPHVTERMYRADSSRNRTTGGSGLGLAIALELVGASGGVLDVRNAEPHGVVVRIQLPSRPRAGPRGAEAASAR